jgi:type II secretory pathway pseudopilin PulG
MRPMHSLTPNPRGMALVMAMIVVVLVTLLVAGAISFTGTERAASEIQTQEDAMSSCAQAARNLFLSKLNMLDFEGPTKIVIDEDLSGSKLRTGHFNQLAEVSARDVSSTMKDPNREVQDISNTDTHQPKTRFYTVTAVCRETEDLSSPEREIEFMVRVGL